MDGRQFDNLLRSWSDSRRTVLGGVIAAAAGLLGISQVDAKKKKKKKPCAKKCQSGCCTGKFGKCIQPAQQNSTQCGSGGEICRSNCGGGGCGAGCESCCAGGVCIDKEDISNQQCGTGGETCFACPPGQACNAPGEGCCAPHGETCRTNGVACCSSLFEACGPNNKCCSETGGSCQGTGDCCDQDKNVCDQGRCVLKPGEMCSGGPEPLMCVTPLSCTPLGGISLCCAANGKRCRDDDDCCDPDEEICESNGDHKVCKKRRGEDCEVDGKTLICQDDYPHCVVGGCNRCPADQTSTGTDELCCDNGFACSAANGGRGACCEHEGCCQAGDEGPCTFPDFPGLQCH